MPWEAAWGATDGAGKLKIAFPPTVYYRMARDAQTWRQIDKARPGAWPGRLAGRAGARARGGAGARGGGLMASGLGSPLPRTSRPWPSSRPTACPPPSSTRRPAT